MNAQLFTDAMSELNDKYVMEAVSYQRKSKPQFNTQGAHVAQKVRVAEGKIPDCKIISSEGFDEGEVGMLEMYMKQNLQQLKKMAAGLRLFDVITKK